MTVQGYNLHTSKTEHIRHDFLFCPNHRGYTVFIWVEGLQRWECSEAGCHYKLGDPIVRR